MPELSQEYLDLKEYLETACTKGLERAAKLYPDLADSEDELLKTINSYIEMVNESYDFLKNIAAGNLSTNSGKMNFISMPAKALQANLKNLIWQTKQIRNGDLNQRINFLGEFSDSFNSLIDSLKEKRKLELEVASNAERLKTITSALGDGVIVTDHDGNISFCNPETCNILGYKLEELLGKQLHSSIHVQYQNGKRIGEIDKFSFKVIKDGKIFKSNNTSFTKKDGEIIPVSVTCTPMPKEDGIHEGVVIVFKDISETKKYQDSLEYINTVLRIQATTDHLTGLYNRQFFNKELSLEIERNNTTDSELSFIIFDIDKFKSINDTYGHNTGDAVLKDLTKIISSHITKANTLARWGGEEFVILMPRTSLDSATSFAEELRKAVETYDFNIGRDVTCSFGVTLFKNQEQENEFIQRADEALYEAKETGRNKVVSK